MQLGATLHVGPAIEIMAATTADGREVALKRLRRHAESRADLVARLLAEGELLQALNGECGVLRCYDVIRSPPTLIIERGRGTLAARLERSRTLGEGGRLPCAEALRVFHAVARAVTHAHARGIIHRDVKPSNVLFTAEGEVRLADFGIAVRRGAPSTAAGWQDVAVGTLGHAAPELLRDPSTANTDTVDVYGLGALLHTMTLGHPPQLLQDEETEAELRARIVAGAHRDRTPHDDRLSPTLRGALDAALASDPSARPPSVSALLTLVDARWRAV